MGQIWSKFRAPPCDGRMAGAKATSSRHRRRFEAFLLWKLTLHSTRPSNNFHVRKVRMLPTPCPSSVNFHILRSLSLKNCPWIDYPRFVHCAGVLQTQETHLALGDAQTPVLAARRVFEASAAHGQERVGFQLSQTWMGS
jgi:hypothetical protein